MFKKNVKFQFRLSYGELYQMSNQTISLVERDISEFEKYGVNASVLNQLVAKKEEFEYIPYDEVFEQKQMLLTQQKNELAEELKTAIREAMLKVSFAYRSNPLVGISFRNGNLSVFTDSELSIRARVTVLLLQDYLGVLSSYGLSQAEIDNLTLLEKSFTNKLAEQQQAICNRDSATEFRVTKANELYYLVSSIREVGRKMWAEKSEALSNDYIISSARSSSNNLLDSAAPPSTGGDEAEIEPLS